MSPVEAAAAYDVLNGASTFKPDADMLKHFSTLSTVASLATNVKLLNDAEHTYDRVDLQATAEQVQAFKYISVNDEFSLITKMAMAKAFEDAQADIKAEAEGDTTDQNEIEANKNFLSVYDKTNTIAKPIVDLVIDFGTVTASAFNSAARRLPMKALTDKLEGGLVKLIKDSGYIAEKLFISEYTEQFMTWVAKFVAGIAAQVGGILATFIDGITTIATSLSEGLSKRLGDK